MADPAYIVDGVLTDGEAWVALASNEPDGTASSVAFTDPSDGSSLDWCQFMDFVLISYARGSRVGAAGEGFKLRLGTGASAVDSGSNYENQHLKGDGSSASASSYSDSGVYMGEFPAATATANIFAVSVIHLFDVNSGKYKSVLNQFAGDRDGAGEARILTCSWKNQGAINKMTIVEGNGTNILSGSRFDLFGVLPRMVA
tara:strand:+ start:101 stop:700 length:600 start_codon:yes stop_codon:yes gene_type:complete